MTTAGPGGFQAGTAVVPATQVEISVQCRNLADMDVFSKSDPMCVLFMKDIKTNTFYEHKETIDNQLNPNFAKKFTLTYLFEELQSIKFEIYDVDSASHNLKNHDFIGRMECSLGEIVGAPGGKLEKPLQGSRRKNGTIIVRGEELSNCKEEITLHFRASHLDKKDFFGKSDPYLQLSRVNEDGSYTVVHRTEVIMKTLNPWRFTIMSRALCNGDYDRSIKFECYDWDKDGYLIHPKKQAKKKKYKDSGEVLLLSYKSEQIFSFLDYIQSGTEMNFTVAIDFTASNGNPSSPSSLHYLNPYGTPNQYAAAIQAVGNIIQDYDSDKLFPALGFGARMSDGSVHHEFALNFNPSNPFCQGVEGVLQAYYNSLKNVQLYGPTNFSPVINHVARFAQAIQDGSQYFVLLIITDGVITDMQQTQQAIVNASRLPMSIIIVGVGDADFTAMNILDGDDVRLSYNGVYAERDIVQFVPFNDFLNRGNMTLSQAALAKEVLAEIPDQFLSYMKKHNVKPRISATAPP
ncbi:copine-8-like [Saccostrea cucullata]|uniref:copine-8-like n=1 Tax=Saccostrea cuccullata TaxID=36930 RepID=UPI002ED69CC7